MIEASNGLHLAQHALLVVHESLSLQRDEFRHRSRLL
jgi:hypothetical protein